MRVEPAPSPEPVPAASARWHVSTSVVSGLAPLGFVAAGLYLCFLLAVPFLSPITWAVAICLTALPVHRRIEHWVGRPNLAAALSVAIAGAAAVGILFFVAQQLIREVADGAVFIEAMIRTGGWRDAIADLPFLSGIVEWLETRLNLADLASAVASWLTEQSTMLLRGSATQIVMLVITFYLLFYFFRDRRLALDSFLGLSPLSETETRQIVDRFADTVHATIFGAVAVASVQGTLSGLMFWWLGLPLPITWGIVMGILALLPVVGAAVVWVPTALFLALQGSWFEAVVLALWGALVVSTIDNLIYPMLVGSRLKLHTVLSLIGALGGLVVFGAAGLVLGPATIAVTLTCIEILSKSLNARGPIPSGERIDPAHDAVTERG
jgi:predicted PurR-regulated permease PerM